MRRLPPLLRASIPLTLAAIACSGERDAAGLMVALDTDLVVPDGIDEVGLYIQQDKAGVRRQVLAQEATPLRDGQGRYVVTFTATLALEAGDDTQNDTVRVRFIGYRGGKAVAMREARVQVPDVDLKRLTLPLRYVNEDLVQDTQSSSQALGLRQAQEDTSGDVFTRYRHPGCGADQTLGDDGECQNIDVKLADLSANDAPAPATCVSTEACFGGERGVRELSLRDCQVLVPDHTAVAVALAIPARGYPTGRATFPSAQPIDAGLYTYANGIITLKPALCRRTTRDAVTTVLVSVKCAPRRLATPICADWQQVKTLVETTEDRFLDDPPKPDASGDADSGTLDPDGGDASDAADSGDASDASDAGDVGLRDIDLDPLKMYDSLGGFAARPDGASWLLLASGPSDNAALIRVRDGARNEFPAQLGEAYLELGVDSSAYLIPTDSGNAYVLPNAATPQDSIVPLQLGNGCMGPSNETLFFTVGTYNGQTVAMYQTGSMSSGMSGGPVGATPDCFPTANPAADFGYFGDRGSTFAGTWIVPAGHSPTAPTLNVATFEPTSASTSFNATEEYLLSSVDIGGQTIVSGHTLNPQEAGGFYELVLDNGEPVVRPEKLLFSNLGRWTSREVFGGGGVLCARLRSPDSEYDSIQCLKRQGGAMTPFLDEPDAENVHVYGDATHAYLATLCYDPDQERYTRARVLTKPWSSVDANFVTELRAGCAKHP